MTDWQKCTSHGDMSHRTIPKLKPSTEKLTWSSSYCEYEELSQRLQRENYRWARFPKLLQRQRNLNRRQFRNWPIRKATSGTEVPPTPDYKMVSYKHPRTWLLYSMLYLCTDGSMGWFNVEIESWAERAVALIAFCLPRIALSLGEEGFSLGLGGGLVIFRSPAARHDS